jgi:hypothetical protein
MRYQVKVAGKIYAGNDPRILLKRAVEAWKTGSKSQSRGINQRQMPDSSYEELVLSH